jgi:hypothetical protein
MPPKTPIWKSIGRTRNRLDLPLPPIACPKRRAKTLGGHRIARKTKKGECEKGGGREIYTVFILERGGDQRSFKLRPAAPRSRLVTTAFKMGCRRIVTLCAFPPSLPLHLTHLRCPPLADVSRRYLTPTSTFVSLYCGFPYCISPLLCLLYF